MAFTSKHSAANSASGQRKVSFLSAFIHKCETLCHYALAYIAPAGLAARAFIPTQGMPHAAAKASGRAGSAP
jgi:hypothetical protein